MGCNRNYLYIAPIAVLDALNQLEKECRENGDEKKAEEYHQEYLRVIERTNLGVNNDY